MMYKALISFTGLVAMAKGDVREISDISLANDLLKAGYIEEAKQDKPNDESEAKPAKASKVTEKKSKSPKGKESTK